TGQGDILCITVASTMSATFDAARLAADRFGGRVEVVDSLSASMAQGFVVKEAAAAVAGGAGLEDAAARAREVARRTWLVATLDTFEYLRRSGRVTALQSFAGSALDITPVIGAHTGPGLVGTAFLVE